MEEQEEKIEVSREIYEWVQCIAIALIVCILVFSFFGRIIDVVGSSMVPTFQNGDKIIISSLSSDYKQGDVVVLRKQAFKDDPIIKRVIATEGQTIDIDFETGSVYVDGNLLNEPYINEPTYRQIDFSGPVTVPEGCVFVMGDNRNNSQDSRYSLIGCVDTRYIIGKAVFRIWPLNSIGANFGSMLNG